MRGFLRMIFIGVSCSGSGALGSTSLAAAREAGSAPMSTPAVPGTWTTGSFADGLSLLLTDGSILQQTSFSAAQWQRIVPDAAGRYDWAHPVGAAAMHDSRGFFPTVVMRDGRVFVAGGEYGTGSRSAEIYDPVANLWTALVKDAPFYDCSCVSLPDGRVMTLPNGGVTRGVVYDPGSNAWTQTAVNAFPFNESGSVQLPGGIFLIVSQTSYPATAKYLSSTDQWIAAAPAPTGAAAFDTGGEGTKTLLYDGRIMALGQTGHIAFYHAGALPADSGSWTPGPTLPDGTKQQDAFAVVMPNGHVLLSGDQGGHNGPTRIYDFDPVTEEFVDVTPPVGGLGGFSDPYMPLLLPTGEVLVSGIGVYAPSAGGPSDSWRPAVSSIADLGGSLYRLTGRQLNGLTEGAYYGDDAQMSTNYPLVRLRGASGTVTYARTFNFSTMALATGTASVTTDFSLPSVPDGTYALEVVANGIPSAPWSVQIQSGHLVSGPAPSVSVNPHPSSVSASPILVTGTASGPSAVSQITWSNTATGGSGTASGTDSWSATIPLATGSNSITITATDSAGHSTTSVFSVDYLAAGPGPSPSGGGGGHGGCGATGLEALLGLGFVALRRRARANSGGRILAQWR